MRVFVSWSGAGSRQLAIAIRDWLPNVIQAAIPYVSSEDIAKGARWSTDLAEELAETSFGILCVNKSNLAAPWILFEAGALAKTVGTSRVVPLLQGLEPSDVTGPLLQFQASKLERSEVSKLLHSINQATGDDALPEQRLDRIFDVWWPKLLETVEGISPDTSISGEELDERESGEILQEVLDLVRSQQYILAGLESEKGRSVRHDMPEAAFLPDEQLNSCIAKAMRIRRELSEADRDMELDHLIEMLAGLKS